MLLILAINAVIVVVLVGIATRKGLEAALPFFAFVVTLLPDECRIQVPGLSLYAHRVALIVLTILFIKARKKTKGRTLPLKRLIVLHIVWAVASTLASIVVVTSFKQLLAQVAEYYLLYYIVVMTITDVRTLSKICYAMIAAMAVCSVFGLLEIYQHWSVLSLFPAELQIDYGTGGVFYSEMFDRGIRARSTFPHPILFGGALAMVIPLVFYLLTTSSKGWSRKIFLNVSMFLMFWALYKTSSRGPWLATGFALFILTAAAESRIRKRVLAVVVLAGLILVLRPGIADTLVNIYTATFDPNSMMGSSFQYRPVLYNTVKETLNDSPVRALLGFGLGSFREKGLVLKMPGIVAHRWYTCDSSWVLFWYETGYVGVLILGTLLLRPAFVALWGLRRLRRSDRYVSLVFLSSLATFYIVMISVAIYGWGQDGHMLWTMIALSTSYTILKKEERRREKTPSAGNSLARPQQPVVLTPWPSVEDAEHAPGSRVWSRSRFENG